MSAKRRGPLAGPSCIGAAISSERIVRIERRQRQLGRELLAPSLLYGGSVHRPQLLAQRMQALEDSQRLLQSTEL